MRALAITCALACATCDSAHDDRFRGDPIFAITGRVVLVGEAPPGWINSVNLRAALWWSTQSDLDATWGPEQQAEVALEFPTGIALALFERPPARVMEVLLPLSGRVAAGQVMVYDDADGNRRWDTRAETVFGMSPVAVMYADREVVGPRITVPRGFSLMLLGGCQSEHGLIGVPVDELLIPIETAGVGTGGDVRGRLGLHCVEAQPIWCAGMAERRERCRADPDLDVCRDCPRIFDESATPIQCDTWRTDCVFDPKYDPVECDSEWRICHCGADAECAPYGLSAPD